MPDAFSGFKRALFLSFSVIVVTALLAVCLYVFRVPMAHLIAPYFLGKDARLTCLQFDLGWSPAVLIKQACIETDAVNLSVINGSLQRFTLDNQNRFTAQQINLLHKPKSSIEHDTPQNVGSFATIPSSIPQLSISALQINSYLLNQPVNLQVEQKHPDQIQFKGDFNGVIHFEQAKISAKVNWTAAQLAQKSAELTEYLNTVAENVDLPSLLSSKIISSVTFDGQTLNSRHQLDLASSVYLQHCQIDFSLSGYADISFNIQQQNGLIDIQNLPISSSMDKCLSLTELSFPDPLKLLTVTLPAPIKWDLDTITLANLEVAFTNLSEQPLARIFDLQMNYSGQMQASYAIQNTVDLALFKQFVTPLQGQLQLTANGSIKKQANSWQLELYEGHWQVDNLTTPIGQTKSLIGHLTASLTHSKKSPWQLTGKAEQRLNDLQFDGKYRLTSMQSQFDFAGDISRHITANLTNTAKQLSGLNAQLAGIESTLELRWSKEQGMQVDGQSLLSQLAYQQFSIHDIALTHHLSTQFDESGVLGSHQFTIDSGLIGYGLHQGSKIDLNIPAQSTKHLQKWARQFDPKINLVAGQIAVSLSTAKAQQFDGELTISNLSFRYDDYQILKLNLDEPFVLDSAGLQLSAGKIAIDEVNVGVPMTQVLGQVSVINSIGKIDNIQASVVGGTFSLDDFWLDKREQIAKLKISGLNLAQLAELHDQKGIEVSGEISGSLPVKLSSDMTIIDNGRLVSDGPGSLKINNNAAFDAIKTQQKELSYLEDVVFEKLTSDVKLAPDGWLDLQISIAGRNPNQKQQVVFNYGHKENVFVLLKTLRVANSIQNSIEKRLQKTITEKGKQK